MVFPSQPLKCTEPFTGQKKVNLSELFWKLLIQSRIGLLEFFRDWINIPPSSLLPACIEPLHFPQHSPPIDWKCRNHLQSWGHWHRGGSQDTWTLYSLLQKLTRQLPREPRSLWGNFILDTGFKGCSRLATGLTHLPDKHPGKALPLNPSAQKRKQTQEGNVSPPRSLDFQNLNDAVLALPFLSALEA